jgi:hypothetical protein
VLHLRELAVADDPQVGPLCSAFRIAACHLPDRSFRVSASMSLVEPANQEKVRHGRIEDVIETTELKAMYAVASEHDFTDVPREVSIGSTESLLAALRM